MSLLEVKNLTVEFDSASEAGKSFKAVDNVSLSIEKGRNDLNISFWPYSLKTLQDAQHIYDLKPNDVTTVNIDCIQNGMSDCFVACGEEYRIKTGQEYSYDFYISADQAV